MYQLQNLDAPRAVDALASSGYDMLIVEPTFLCKGDETFDARSMVKKLHESRRGRIVLAYLDIGEAESFRTYWQADWKIPTRERRGSPDFILAADPDGWSGDYPVAYWDERWQKLWLDRKGILNKVMADGFDGVYLDWVGGCEEPLVMAAAGSQNVNADAAMVDWIGRIREAIRRSRPDALVVAQNVPYLIDRDARYATVIDGIGFEDTRFSGKSDAGWASASGGDRANHQHGDDSTAALVRQYQKYLKAGIPVFTIDYCLKPENAAKVYRESAAAGFVPLVTRVSLERMTETPPPGIGNLAADGKK